MSLGGVPRSAAESAGVNHGVNSSTGAAGSNGGAVAGGSGVRAGSIGSDIDGLGAAGLGLFQDSFGFPMEGFTFDGVLSAVASGAHFTPGDGGIGGRQLQQNHIHNQQQQIMQQQPSPSSGSPHQPQVQQQQPQQSRQQQLQQQVREQAAAAHHQSANVSAQLAAAVGQLPQSTLSRTKQLNKVAGPNGGGHCWWHRAKPWANIIASGTINKYQPITKTHSAESTKSTWRCSCATIATIATATAATTTTTTATTATTATTTDDEYSGWGRGEWGPAVNARRCNGAGSVLPRHSEDIAT